MWLQQKCSCIQVRDYNNRSAPETDITWVLRQGNNGEGKPHPGFLWKVKGGSSLPLLILFTERCSLIVATGLNVGGSLAYGMLSLAQERANCNWLSFLLWNAATQYIDGLVNWRGCEINLLEYFSKHPKLFQVNSTPTPCFFCFWLGDLTGNQTQ